jgi:hypothetical protein
MHPNENVLHDYVDGIDAAAERPALEQHLAACASCRRLVEDLRDIKRAVATLEQREPPVRVWSRIERAIKLELEHGAELRSPAGVPPHQAAAEPGTRGARGVRWAPWLAAAAAVVLATLVGLRLMPGRTAGTSVPTASTSSAAAGAAVQSIESELKLAESHYEKAIKGLEEVTSAGEQSLDPRTAATLHKNFAVIDQAINESRAAVRSQPASEPAQQSLIENFKTKIALLQDTVALINEMRKGNEAGAARIVSGLKQKG